MAKLIITRSDETVQEIELNKARMTIGRHPKSHIVLAHPAVSGHHAAVSIDLTGVLIEDLGSTNGTFINGRRASKQALADGDSLTIALYQLKFVAGPVRVAPTGRIQVITGPHAGKALALSKPLTTLGKPGAAVLAITRDGAIYSARAIEGAPTINGSALNDSARQLADGDEIDLGGTQMTFFGR